ncbi:hydroxymethylbilane synthase [Fusibacter bizertensis]
MTDRTITVGTRGSNLAVTQTKWVIETLKKQFPNVLIEMKIIVTKGDEIKDVPLDKIGDKGLFTAAIEAQLLNGDIDFAVHSMKDLPSEFQKGLKLSKIPKREDPRDVLVLREGLKSFKELPLGAKIGTGSKRRLFQLLAHRPDIMPVPIRGNVETRIKKIDIENLDGVILAAAGLHRLGLSHLITEYLPLEFMTPSPAQGALGLQFKEGNTVIEKMLSAIAYDQDDICVRAERSFLKHTNGGCHVPIGAHAMIKEGQLQLRAVFGDEAGTSLYRVNQTGSVDFPEGLGEAVANEMLRLMASEVESKVESKGLVSLVGAGPGDPKLITVKGLERLRTCEVVVYDRLSSPQLLKEVPAYAERIYVGKAASNHAMPQEEINQLLVNLAYKYKRIVRLKGGDPYVFGRGGEEALKLRAHHIPFEVVPGITSPIAGLGYAGVPITHRDIASSFHVFTGQLKDGENQIDYEAVSRLDGTLVFLMSIANFKNISAALIQSGKSASTPAAIISSATTYRQQVMVSTLGAMDQFEEIPSPAFFVVGDVLHLREELNWFEHLPLFGKRIMVTRATKQSSTITDKLYALGADVASLPMIEIVPTQLSFEKKQLISDLTPYSHIWFTSENAVRIFFDLLEEQRKDSRALGDKKILAIGPATANALKAFGIKADDIPAQYTQEGIIALMASRLSKRHHVLLPVAEDGRDEIENQLEERCQFTRINLYHTEIPQYSVEKNPLEGLDVITFTSASTVIHFHEMKEKNNWTLEANTKLLSIGPITTETLMNHGYRNIITAQTHTIDGMLELLIGATDETL